MRDPQAWAWGLALVSAALPAAWCWFKQKQGDRDNPRWQHLEEQWPGGVARFFYYAGLPYLALLAGILTPRLLGLTGLEYFDFTAGGPLPANRPGAGLQTALFLMLVELFAGSGRVVVASLAAVAVLLVVRAGLLKDAPGLAGSRPVFLPEIIYTGLHWAFYRAIFWQITGNLYQGVVFGTGLVLVEWSLVNRLKTGRYTWTPRLLRNTIVLVLTSAVFFYGPNLWLLWPVQWVMEVVLGAANPVRNALSGLHTDFPAASHPQKGG